MGSPKIKSAGPSAQETAALEAQTKALQQQSDIVQKQYAQQQLLLPILYKQAGLNVTLDEQGNITGVTEADNPLAQMEQDLQTAFIERTQKALRGEIPLDTGLVSSVDKQEAELRERLRKQLGSGFETSTPGIQALSEFGTQKQSIFDAARRGDLSLGESLNLAQGQANQSRISDFLSRGAGISGLPLGSASAYGQNAAGYNSPLQYWQNQRNSQNQVNAFNAQQGGGFGALFKGIGSLAGGLFGSSRDFKEKIEPYTGDVLDMVENTPIYTWYYKGDDQMHVGPVTEEAPEIIVSADGKALVSINYMGFMFAAIKALNAKVARLEHG